MASCAIWEVVGGAEKGGIVVREDADLKSSECPRLAPGALVQQLALQGDRLRFAKTVGVGPATGWVSICLRDKPLLTLRGEISKEEIQRIETANGNGTTGTNSLCESLWKWRFYQLAQVEQDLEMASKVEPGSASKRALLAFNICMSRFPEALSLAEELGEKEVQVLVEQWEAEAEKLSSLFFPCHRNPAVGHQWISGSQIRQTDIAWEVDGAVLGLRLLLQCEDGQPIHGFPVVLMFHGEDQNIDTFCEEENLEAWRAANVHLLIADFRGYGFSTGTSSHYHLRPDGERICRSLPQLFERQQLPWPWPGGWAVYGNGLGSRVACFLAALKGTKIFNRGLVLETGWAGSYAPGAKALPEPPKHTALATMGCNAAGDSRFGSRQLHLCAAQLGRKARQLLTTAMEGNRGPELAQYVFVRGNEDLIQAFDGEVLILHGEVDHLVPAEHAVRLHQAAVRAGQRHLVLAKGKRADSLRNSPEYSEALQSFFGQKKRTDNRGCLHFVIRSDWSC